MGGGMAHDFALAKRIISESERASGARIGECYNTSDQSLVSAKFRHHDNWLSNLFFGVFGWVPEPSPKSFIIKPIQCYDSHEKVRTEVPT